MEILYLVQSTLMNPYLINPLRVKIVGILLGIILLVVPFSVDAISVSEVERKLSQAQRKKTLILMSRNLIISL